MKQLWLVNQLNGVMFYNQDISSNFMENICWENVSQISTNLDERSPRYGKPTSNANHRDILEELFIYNVGNGWWNLSTMIVRVTIHLTVALHTQSCQHTIALCRNGRAAVGRWSHSQFWTLQFMMSFVECSIDSGCWRCVSGSIFAQSHWITGRRYRSGIVFTIRGGSSVGPSGSTRLFFKMQ